MLSPTREYLVTEYSTTVKNNEIYYADASELSARIHSKDVSPVDVVRAHLERIESVNPKLNAIVTVADSALERAREAEAAIVRGESWGPLHGVPFTMKDVFDTAGVRTTRGSKLFAARIPSRDATVVERLKKAGGILIGKTNVPEFALAAETSNVLFGRTRNPWNLDRTPGGSSGGEAAAIAAGMSPLGVGSDLGGSNRVPAHYCGIVGLKATHGRVPLTGHWPELLAHSMHAGPMARSVRDVVTALTVLSGSDGRDPYATPAAVPDFSRLLVSLPRLRVAWLAEGPFDPVAEEIQAVVGHAAVALEELGCTVEPISLSSWREFTPIDVCLTLLASEGIHYLSPFVAGRHDELAGSIRGLFDLRTPSLEEHLRAVRRCEEFRADMAELFSIYDLLLCPVAPLVAHAHDASELRVDEHTVPPHHAASITASFGLSGSPAISIPFGWSRQQLPIGVQLVAHRFHEETLLQVATGLEKLYAPPSVRPPL